MDMEIRMDLKISYGLWNGYGIFNNFFGSVSEVVSSQEVEEHDHVQVLVEYPTDSKRKTDHLTVTGKIWDLTTSGCHHWQLRMVEEVSSPLKGFGPGLAIFLIALRAKAQLGLLSLAVYTAPAAPSPPGSD